ncbi:MAG: membrane dipeptidase [Pseudomonadota bacterium]
MNKIMNRFTLHRRLTASLVTTFVLTASQIAVGSTHNADGQAFAHSCILIKSSGENLYLKRKSKAYDFDAKRVDAASFFVKPSGLGHYLLFEEGKNYLSQRRYGGTYASRKPTLDRSVWTMNSIDGVAYEFKNSRSGKVLKNEYWETKRRGVFSWKVRVTETKFEVSLRDGCRETPEITVNALADQDALKSGAGRGIRGFVDAHTHISSFEMIGGRLVHGKTFHPLGVEYALSDGRETHGNLQSLISLLTPTIDDSTKGWPDFYAWPNRDATSYTGYYHKWIERAYLSGQRMMVTYMTGLQILCDIYTDPVLNPAKSCDTIDTVNRQIDFLYQLEDYIDAQFGGRGNGFFRIVTSPEQARRTIEDGKLAVVLGVEISEVLDCGLKDKNCNESKIESGLQQLYKKGVRVMFPGHKVDNQLTGVVYETFPVDVANVASSGSWFDVGECRDGSLNPQNQDHTSSLLFGTIGGVINDVSNYRPRFLRKLAPEGILALLWEKLGQGELPEYPDYPYLAEHEHGDDEDLVLPCNTRGLTRKGAYLVNRMIDLGMIIDIDHLSDKSANTVLDIAETRNFSSIVSSHSYLHADEPVRGGLGNSMRRILHLGGFVSPMSNRNSTELGDLISHIAEEIEKTNYIVGIGIGTDMSGFATQAPPRGDVENNPLVYPYETEFGGVFDRQISGNRTFDLNSEGIAHYGMLPDYIQDIRVNTDERVYEAIMSSAEAYLQMWERGLNAYHGHVYQQGSQ